MGNKRGQAGFPREGGSMRSGSGVWRAPRPPLTLTNSSTCICSSAMARGWLRGGEGLERTNPPLRGSGAFQGSPKGGKSRVRAGGANRTTSESCGHSERNTELIRSDGSSSAAPPRKRTRGWFLGLPVPDAASSNCCLGWAHIPPTSAPRCPGGDEQTVPGPGGNSCSLPTSQSRELDLEAPALGTRERNSQIANSERVPLG
ncbi:uncharacterized protein LOC122456621 isoform X1 [Dermochelys coriacea]|uniref:uncharacterized protein LOC122456621 isoform X1 n=1 Tax=Dermochelys coriacea TaxID=27794 RepID=UPI001CAA1EB1|nr:uncharacterized protein LOC122456621 isoform X1 [Dermochelys coriacea]